MNDETADISNAIECHNVYDNGAHKCTVLAAVNKISLTQMTLLLPRERDTVKMHLAAKM